MLEVEVDKRATIRMFNIMEVKFDDMFRDVWYKINNEFYSKEITDQKIKDVKQFVVDNYNSKLIFWDFETYCKKWFERIEEQH